VGLWAIRLATFVVVLAVGLFASFSESSSSPSVAFRPETYHGVSVAVPEGLVLVRHAYVVDCTVSYVAAVYEGALEQGMCATENTDPNFLSVTLSPLNAFPMSLSTLHLASVSVKLVRSRHVAVAVWHSRYRAADAAKIIASVRAT
jgi:hypothetical protein